MHDIQRELSIVEAWTVHSKRIAIRSGKLRREHRSVAEDHDVTFPKVHRGSLSAAGCRSWIRISPGIASTAESDNFMNARLSGGPFSD